ncbi:hypothetical protein [Prosthecobacter sp.]|uniref:hypothetical protein n=1 Tax=Prosthecobacter sp. TaxID=1965333 RepID=UPI00378479FB
MALALLAGVSGLLGVPLAPDQASFWFQLLMSLGFLASGLLQWKARRQFNAKTEALRAQHTP